MEVQVNQVLKYKNEPVGVRAHYRNENTFYDIDIMDLKGVNPIHLKGYSSIMLVEHGDKLVTMLEKETGVLVPTLEGSSEFIQAVAAFILNDFATRTGGNVAKPEPRPKPEPQVEAKPEPKPEAKPESKPEPKAEASKPEAPKKQTKSAYLVKVQVPVYDPKEREFIDVTFEGEFKGVDKDSAEEEAKEFYAHQENTEIGKIKVISSKKKTAKKKPTTPKSTEEKPKAQKLKDYTILLGVTTLGADGKTVETKEIKRDFQATSLVAVKPIAREELAKEYNVPLRDVKVLKAGVKK